MKRYLIAAFLSGAFSLSPVVSLGKVPAYAEAETSSLMYEAGAESIQLEIREDIIGVKFTRRRSGSSKNPFLQLKADLLKNRTRSERIEVRPVDNYATVRSTGRTRGTSSLSDRLSQLNYIDRTLPVLTRTGSRDVILLPNEIILTLKEGTDPTSFFRKHDLSLIRPIEYTKHSYLVRSTEVQGTDILALSNDLNQMEEVEAAGPNFIYQFSPQTTFNPNSSNSTSAQQYLPEDARSYQWGLDSRMVRANQPRTDIHAPEAWKVSRDGKGVVVAVLDNLIDWEHPDLKKNILTDANGEVIAKDLVDNDADTRMNDDEKKFLTQYFQESFTLSDDELLKQHYNFYCAQLHGLQELDELARCTRESLRGGITGEFHGNMSAGVIASRSKRGGLGVAPKAKIVPVRVLGFQGGTDESILRGIRFAAEQKVDVINMSLGGHPFALPNPSTAHAIKEILENDPKLIMVASSGNNGLSAISYPSKYEGIVSVGATNMNGERTQYSNYGEALDVVAPGGDLSEDATGGILTHTGVYRSEFWDGIEPPNEAWAYGIFDPYGKYSFVQGTSFSAPMISGVFALMKSNDKKRQLSRAEMIELLKQASSYEPLAEVTSPQVIYGAGIVNAEEAVRAVKERL